VGTQLRDIILVSAKLKKYSPIGDFFPIGDFYPIGDLFLKVIFTL
jgi:hypothetical protein